MDKKLLVSSSPHIRDNAKTSKLMLDVIIALVPALVMGTYIFGTDALIVTAVTVISCIVFEYGYNVLLKQRQTVGDLSCVVTGLLLAYNLPSTLPIWMTIVGSFVAIVVVKMLFGGLGKNFANPAIVGRIFLFVSFAGAMSTYPKAFYYQNPSEPISGATPLGVIKEAYSSDAFANIPSDMDLLLGFHGGVIGETCALALIIGGLYLVIKKVINPIIPLSFIGTVFVLTMAIGAYPVQQILTGGLMIGAIFMATDYVTSPLSNKGKLVFGIGCGVITVAIRLFATYPEGVSFSILLMNILVPHIEKYTRNKPFGGVKIGK